MPPSFWIPWILVPILIVAGLIVMMLLAVFMLAALSVAAALHVLGWDRRLLDWLARRLDVRVAALHFPEKEKPEVDDLEAPIEARWTVVEERRSD